MSETATASPQTSASRPGWGIYLVWAAIIAVLSILGWGLLNSTATRPEPGETAPEFSMTYFNGYEWESRPVADLTDMRGSVVMLNFWASWCVECRYEAELLQATAEQYADNGVILLGIAWADSEPKSLAYMQEFGITYPNAPDLGTRIGPDYEITGVPETFFIDREGVIRQVIIGPVTQEMLDGILPTLLEG